MGLCCWFFRFSLTEAEAKAQRRLLVHSAAGVPEAGARLADSSCRRRRSSLSPLQDSYLRGRRAVSLGTERGRPPLSRQAAPQPPRVWAEEKPAHLEGTAGGQAGPPAYRRIRRLLINTSQRWRSGTMSVLHSAAEDI